MTSPRELSPWKLNSKFSYLKKSIEISRFAFIQLNNICRHAVWEAVVGRIQF